MARLNIPSTKSNLLGVQHQLAFATEGYDLLEQKRRILLVELLARAKQTREAELQSAKALRPAFESLHNALINRGADAVDRSSFGIDLHPEVSLGAERVLGITLPRVTVSLPHPSPQFGPLGVSPHTHQALQRFLAALPLLARQAQLQTAVFRLAHELRKAQRRCNALSRIFIPSYHGTATYITTALEERERESLSLLKRIRTTVATHPQPPGR